MKMTNQGMTYEKAGVDINESDRFLAMIKERIAINWPIESRQIGGFAGLAKIPDGARDLSTSTDGVGTKLIIAALMDEYSTGGQDAVAMSAVDTYVSGQLPKYLLDYFVTGKLNADKHIKLFNSLIYGCKLAGCSIIGGETAEMPGLFKHDWYIDLATFVIGFPIPGLAQRYIKNGDIVLGWPSNCLASNGFSLVRKVFELSVSPSKARKKLERRFPELNRQPLFEVLLEPTPIWIREIEKLRLGGVNFSAHAHITGGGLIDNPPRILQSDDLKIVIERNSWQRPVIFDFIQEKGKISQYEMDRTFNNGIMMISVVDKKEIPKLDNSIIPFKIGVIEKRKNNEPPVILTGKYC
jgi:phosphoribosylformylglycinamidine cyclo-ligase